MKRITRHLVSGMATAGLALSASGLGLPISTPPLSSAPAPDAVNPFPWTQGESADPGWHRDASDPVASMEAATTIWVPGSGPDQIGFSILGATEPNVPLTPDPTPQNLAPRPMAGDTHFNPLNGPASLSEPATLTLLALGLACLAIRDSLARKHIRPTASTPAPGNAVSEAPAARVSQGALLCVPPRDARPFECTPIARSHKNRRRRRA